MVKQSPVTIVLVLACTVMAARVPRPKRRGRLNKRRPRSPLRARTCCASHGRKAVVAKASNCESGTGCIRRCHLRRGRLLTR